MHRLLLLLLLPAVALARPTGGVLQPDEDVAAGAEASQAETNPAGLGFGQRFSLAYTFGANREDRPDAGHAVFAQLGIADYHMGLGLQVLEVPGEERPLKFTWAHALKLSPALAVGFAWHRFESGPTDATWDLGAQLRPSRWLALGGTVTDLGAPAGTDRGYRFGIALRPGTEAVTVSGFSHRFEDDTPTVYGGLVQLKLWSTLALLARYETQEVDEAREHRVVVGLTDLGRFGLGAFGQLSEDGFEGMSGTVRLRADEPAWGQGNTVVEVVITETDELAQEGFFNRELKAPFLDQLLALQALARDPDVSGVVIAFGDPEMGWARAAELRRAILELKAAGKKVLVYATLADSKLYSVAVAADRIYTAPAGGLMLTGLEGSLLNIGGLLAKLGIKAEFAAIGDYKSAPEFFTRERPSEHSAFVENALLDDLYGRLIAAIAEGRKMTPEQARAAVDQGPYDARAAKDAGLLDGVLHYDELEETLRDLFGRGVRFAQAEEYLKAHDHRWGTLPAIGVLYAVGNLTDGESVINPLFGATSTGVETFVKAAQRLEQDRSVKAVVLRIDSPGGSVTAADTMWRALRLLARKKPVLVSMGDVAASGGYYIAVAGSPILASDETLTGSIGIFTGKFDLSGLFGLLGVQKTLFLRGEKAGVMSEAKPWTEAERAAVVRGMEALYQLFLERVAAGRPALGLKGVGPLARGRVWTGAQARACGLVDRPEGLLTAIDLAVLQAGLGEGDYRLVIEPEGEGLGSLPRSPVHVLDAFKALLFAQSAEDPLLPEALRRLSRQPVLAYPGGTPLALWPYAL